MVKLRNDSFHKILAWLKEANTDPILLEIISTFWYGQEVQLDSDTSLTIRSCTEEGIFFFKAHLPLTALEKILPELFFEAATSTTLTQG